MPKKSKNSSREIVPELSARDNTPGDDDVTVLAVASSFDCR
jgi:hypothetical protein